MPPVIEPADRPRQSSTSWRWPVDGRASALAAVILLAAALRMYPMHVAYIHPDQAIVPAVALSALERGDWEMAPGLREYPTGFMFTLRAAYSVQY